MYLRLWIVSLFEFFERFNLCLKLACARGGRGVVACCGSTGRRKDVTTEAAVAVAWRGTGELGHGHRCKQLTVAVSVVGCPSWARSWASVGFHWQPVGRVSFHHETVHSFSNLIYPLSGRCLGRLSSSFTICLRLLTILNGKGNQD